MCHGDIDFEAYEIGRACQIFKLVSLSPRKLQSLLLFGISAYGNSQLMNPKAFFGELKRRNVYKVAVAYAVVAWLLIQAATQVFPFFGLPNWAVQMVVLATVIGFPVALVLSWAFELTPEGIKREEEVDSPRPRKWQTLRRMPSPWLADTSSADVPTPLSSKCSPLQEKVRSWSTRMVRLACRT